MILLAQIQRVEKTSFQDKNDKTKTSEMFQIVLSDATKPAQFRCTTPFITFATADGLTKALGTVDLDELTDMPVTLAVKEIGPYNAMLKVKGQLVKGHQTGQALQAMNTAAASAPAPGAPPKPQPAGKP